VVTPEGQKGDIGRRNGVIAQGARLVSAIADGGNVFEFVSRATVRFLLIEGLDILGGGREGHGIGLAALNGCTAYSRFNQKRLIDAYVVGQLVMIGCAGSGRCPRQGCRPRPHRRREKARATIVSPSGAIEYTNGFEGLEIAGKGSGARFSGDWQSPNLAQLGNHRLWIDRRGRLPAVEGRRPDVRRGRHARRGLGLGARHLEKLATGFRPGQHGKSDGSQSADADKQDARNRRPRIGENAVTQR